MSFDPRLVETFTAPTNSKIFAPNTVALPSLLMFHLMSCSRRHQILGQRQREVEHPHELIGEFDVGPGKK